MINLDLQIASLLFSFIFGFFASIMIEINYKINTKKILKTITTFILIIINTLIYFIGLNNINNAYLHPYFILMILLGSISEIFLKRKLYNMFVKVKSK